MRGIITSLVNSRFLTLFAVVGVVFVLVFIARSPLLVKGGSTGTEEAITPTPETPTIIPSSATGLDIHSLIGLLKAKGSVHVEKDGKVVRVETKGDTTSVYITTPDGGKVEGTWNTNDLETILNSSVASAEASQK